MASTSSSSLAWYEKGAVHYPEAPEDSSCMLCRKSIKKGEWWPVKILECGHMIHQACRNDMLSLHMKAIEPNQTEIKFKCTCDKGQFKCVRQ